MSTSRTSQPVPPPRARRWVASALVALVGAAAAQGVTQEAALAYLDPAVAIAEARVEEARRSIARPTGLAYGASLTPRVTLADRLDDDAEPAWSTDVGISGEVSYRYDPVALVREERALERALADVASARREGVLRALRAHVAWWTQSRALATATDRLSAAQADWTEGEAASARGEVDPLQLDGLRLALDRADLAEREARHRAAAAAQAAADVGLRGDPAYAPVRFALPEPDVAALYAVRRRHLAVAEAEADLLEAQLRVPDDVRLTASYATQDLRIAGEFGIINRTPGADVALSYPGASNPAWSVGLRAEIAIDASTLRTIEAARDDGDEAREALRAFLSTYPDDVAAARQSVDFAEEGLGFAERALDLEQRRLEEGRAQLDAARQGGAGERELTGLQREVDRGATALDRAEGALLSAWNAYVGRVDAYLALVQGDWTLRTAPSR